MTRWKLNFYVKIVIMNRKCTTLNFMLSRWAGWDEGMKLLPEDNPCSWCRPEVLCQALGSKIVRHASWMLEHFKEPLHNSCNVLYSSATSVCFLFFPNWLLSNLLCCAHPWSGKDNTNFNSKASRYEACQTWYKVCKCSVTPKTLASQYDFCSDCNTWFSCRS